MKTRIFKILLACLLCGLLLFGAAACNGGGTGEVDPYEDGYGTYYLGQYSYDSDDGSNLAFTRFEALELMVSGVYGKEKFDFAKEIKAFIGDYVIFSKQGIEFSGEFREVVPYTLSKIYSDYFWFEQGAFPEGKHLDVDYRVFKPSTGTYYMIILESTIYLEGLPEEERPDGYREPFLTFKMHFYKGVEVGVI